MTHEFFHFFKVRSSKNAPFGNNHESIYILQGTVLIFCQRNLVPESIPDVGHSFRVMSKNFSSGLYEFFYDIDSWRFPYIIGVWLERQSPYSDLFAFYILIIVVHKFVKKDRFLLVFDGHDGIQYLPIKIVFLFCPYKGFYVFGRTSAPKTNSRKQIPYSDPGIGSDSYTCLINIGS